MEYSTEYLGPDQSDYDNVLALNTAFLNAFYDLKGPQRGRLAAAPFLLFSLRENDLDWWERALSDEPQRELDENSTTHRDLQCACIGFLWQLARRNPYAVRIISGASIAWCEQLTVLPLVTALERVGTRSDLLQSRLDDSDALSTQLLDRGVNARRRIRRSSHFVALQSLLTRSGGAQHHRLAAAACSMPAPRVKVTEHTANRVREKVTLTRTRGYNTPPHERPDNKKPE